MLLAAAYFPPIEYFAAMAAGFTLSADRVNPSVVYVEACENYQKQSWRNRCGFYAESGIQYLNFPVRHHRDGSKVPIKEVLVDYSTPWVERHKRAIVSAYRTSAYFEYYQDELFSILDSHPDTLWELDMALTRFFIGKSGMPVELRERIELFERGVFGAGRVVGVGMHQQGVERVEQSAVDLEFEPVVIDVGGAGIAEEGEGLAGTNPRGAVAGDLGVEEFVRAVVLVAEFVRLDLPLESFGEGLQIVAVSGREIRQIARRVRGDKDIDTYLKYIQSNEE